MFSSLKKAIGEWIDNLFIFETGLNLFIATVTMIAIAIEIVFAFYSNDWYMICFNPMTIWMAIVSGACIYQIVELMIKYNAITK